VSRFPNEPSPAGETSAERIPSDQRWLAFLEHQGAIAAMDFSPFQPSGQRLTVLRDQSLSSSDSPFNVTKHRQAYDRTAASERFRLNQPSLLSLTVTANMESRFRQRCRSLKRRACGLSKPLQNGVAERWVEARREPVGPHHRSTRRPSEAMLSDISLLPGTAPSRTGEGNAPPRLVRYLRSHPSQ